MNPAGMGTETATASTGSGNLKLWVTWKVVGSITRTAPSSEADKNRDAGNESLRYDARHVICF